MIRKTAFRVVIAFAGFVCVRPARADDPAEIARIHVAAIGGRERIEALHAYRAAGRIEIGGATIGLSIVAARPNRLRVEMRYADHTIVQATDGVHPPWQFDSSARAAQREEMAAAVAVEFAAEAEFDDPLVDPTGHGCEIDRAGDVDANGRRFIRLLVTQRLTHTYFLLIDPETYFIEERIEERSSLDGSPVRMITRYADFRPVAGVLMPHRVSVLVDGQPMRTALLDRVEPNPRLADRVFTHVRP